MATEYTLKRGNCPECGNRLDEDIAISAAGSGMSLRRTPSRNSWRAWRTALAEAVRDGATIQDEYGYDIEFPAFVLMVENSAYSPGGGCVDAEGYMFDRCEEED